jgi:hypothetical protein
MWRLGERRDQATALLLLVVAAIADDNTKLAGQLLSELR